MFKIEWRDHYYQPRLLCDSCSKLITALDDAVFTWPKDADADADDRVFVVHADCVQWLWVGNESEQGGVMPVEEYLANLADEQAAVAEG